MQLNFARVLSLFSFALLALTATTPRAVAQTEDVPIIDLTQTKSVETVTGEIEADGNFSWVVVEEKQFAAAKKKNVIKVEPSPQSNGDPSQLTAGQLMHIYVAGAGGDAIAPGDGGGGADDKGDADAGPLDGRGLIQWGTILGTIAFVICIVIRIFGRK